MVHLKWLASLWKSPYSSGEGEEACLSPLGTLCFSFFFFFQAEDGIRYSSVTGVQTCALPILAVVSSFDFHAPNATAEIRGVESRIDRIEADTLARVKTGSGGELQKVELLGKLLLFDRELSVNKNEACAFCHMPETGFTGPVSSLNASTVAYPGSVRTRFSTRQPQSHTYAVFAPALHYN